MELGIKTFVEHMLKARIGDKAVEHEWKEGNGNKEVQDYESRVEPSSTGEKARLRTAPVTVVVLMCTHLPECYPYLKLMQNISKEKSESHPLGSGRDKKSVPGKDKPNLVVAHRTLLPVVNLEPGTRLNPNVHV